MIPELDEKMTRQQKARSVRAWLNDQNDEAADV